MLADRRRPGQSSITTPRKETDQVQILSGKIEKKFYSRDYLYRYAYIHFFFIYYLIFTKDLRTVFL